MSAAGHADRGHDRRRILRRARQGLGDRTGAVAPGGDALGYEGCPASSRVGWQLSFCSSPVRARASADEFRTPSISAVRVEWRAALDQFRAEINTQPAVASDFTFSGQRRRACVRSALDAGAGAAERGDLADLSPASGAARCRCCCRSTPRPISTRGRTARPTASRCRATRRTSVPPTCSTPGPPATTRCFRSSPAPATACRSGPLPSRSKCRSPARS